MARFMMETSRKIAFMGLGITDGKIEVTMANGKAIKCTEKALSPGTTEKSMSEVIKTTKNMDLESQHPQLGESMRASGKTENKMGKASIQIQKEL